MKSLLTFLSLLMAGTTLAQTMPADPAPQSVKPADLVAAAKPSLVIVQFTYDGELGRREVAGMGVVVRDDGLTMFSIDLTPRPIPDEQLKDFKIVIPGDEEIEHDAEFLGRDERYGVSFIKPTKADQKFTPLKFVQKNVEIGQPVHSVGLLPKMAGYSTYYASAIVSASLRGPIPQILVGGGGLAVIGSPVFDSAGQAIGLVNSQSERTPLLNEPRAAYITVDNPPLFYTPASDFLPGITSPPESGKPIRMPFMGINQLTGLSKDVAEFYGLKGQVAIQIGDVVPGFPADKGGLKKGHIIVKADGQPLERGDEPEEAPLIFTRKLSQKNIGDKVVLSVITETGKPPQDMEITLEERPMPSTRAKRYYAEDLGFTTRDVVFDDTYQRKIAKDSKGVVITFIRPQSASQAAQLQMNDLVQQLNQTPVTNVEQFKTDYTKFRTDRSHEAVVLEVLRQGNTQIIRIEPPKE
ncbi:MAG: hypothetical protein H7144_09725 [Burkholderiales bacterium]|nr:hypothetical protein [Phycisphaerae bacterium]